MRLRSRRDESLGRGHAAWPLVFILLSLSVARHSAHPTEADNLLPTENPEAFNEEGDVAEGDSWGWSAGGWLSFGGWSSSWKSAVTGTRSMFRWRFGNAPHEESDGGATPSAAAAEAGASAEATTVETAPEGAGGRRCEELRMVTCRDLGYNETSMPNLLNHESQDIALVELSQYNPLVKVNCSRDMAFFLCALHAPRCPEDGREGGSPLFPCRSVCERIKSRCNVVMERFDFTWPSIFECERYPEPLQSHCAGQ